MKPNKPVQGTGLIGRFKFKSNETHRTPYIYILARKDFLNDLLFCQVMIQS